jgi:hypothetical protein
VPAEGLPDQDDRAEVELLDDRDDVVDECAAREVAREALATAVAALVQRQDAVTVRQPGGRLGPLARVAGQAVEQQRGSPVASEVEADQTDGFALELQPVDSRGRSTSPSSGQNRLPPGGREAPRRPQEGVAPNARSPAAHRKSEPEPAAARQEDT